MYHCLKEQHEGKPVRRLRLEGTERWFHSHHWLMHSYFSFLSFLEIAIYKSRAKETNKLF